MKLQLSISMLVSDRAESVRRCLSSLLPILRKVPSELIVVYTGKGEESLDVVREYTDHIIPYTWCDDFSAARNTGLKEACGEWFLYIDDDEWFEDCSEMVKFFENGECDNYNSASYLQRNYSDIEGTSYADTWVARMIRRTPQTRFVGTIHEALAPLRAPEKYFQTYAHHYGYVVMNTNRKSAKYDRNVPLLIKEIKNNPNEVKNYVQLAQEYHSNEEYEKAEECCAKALQLKVLKEDRIFVDWARFFIMVCLTARNDFKTALKTGTAILQEHKCGELCQLCVCMFLVGICEKLEKYEDGLKYTDDFFRLVEELDAKPQMWEEQQLLSMSRMSIMADMHRVYIHCILCATHLEQYEKVKFYLQRIPWGTFGKMSELYTFFEEWKQKFKEKEAQLLECFSELEVSDDYVTFQKALLAELRGDNEKTKELYHLCGGTSNGVIEYQVILMAIRRRYHLPEFLNFMDLDGWRLCAQKVAENGKFDDYDQFNASVQILFMRYPIHRSVLEQKILPRFLFANQLSDEEFDRVIRRYCEVVLEVNHTLYRDELFTDEKQFCLPVECRAVSAIYNALSSADAGNIAEAVAALKSVLFGYPALTSLVKRILAQIDKEFHESSDPNRGELERMGNQVKLSMMQLIKEGRYEEALDIAKQLCGLLPDDLEVLRWKQKLLTLTV